jgi:hypothetical protein
MDELTPSLKTIKRKSISGIIRKFSTHQLKKVMCQLIQLIQLVVELCVNLFNLFNGGGAADCHKKPPRHNTGIFTPQICPSWVTSSPYDFI